MVQLIMWGAGFSLRVVVSGATVESTEGPYRSGVQAGTTRGVGGDGGDVRERSAERERCRGSRGRGWSRISWSSLLYGPGSAVARVGVRVCARWCME